jgi:hypothetical protein
MKTPRIVILVEFVLSVFLSACSIVPRVEPTATIAVEPTATIAIDVKITSPVEGAKVDQRETVKGTSQEIPNGSVIWVAVFLPTVGRYFPQNQPAVIQAHGEWSSLAYIGQQSESGLKADIIAIVADKSTQDKFNNYLQDAKDKQNYAGLEQIPEGAKIYQSVSVIRK